MDFLLDQNNYFLVIVAVTAAIALAWPAIMRGRSGVRSIPVQEAVQLANQKNALFIDIRAADSFKTGHIAQSRNMPVADFAGKHGSLPKDKPLIVVCERGRSNLNAAGALRKFGFTDIYSLEGGLQEWIKAGMPLSRKA